MLRAIVKLVVSVSLLIPALACANTPIKDMPSGIYEVDKTHASITWKVSHLGLSNYTARFTDLDANVMLNANSPEMSTVQATIKPASVRTDYPYPEKKDFDAKLANDENWFNSSAFPVMTFASKEIKLTGDNTADIMGELTMLGVTKPVTLKTTLNGSMLVQPFAKKPAMGFSATTVIKRSEWGFDTYIPTIGDDVTVLIEAEFIKADAQ